MAATPPARSAESRHVSTFSAKGGGFEWSVSSLSVRSGEVGDCLCGRAGPASFVPFLDVACLDEYTTQHLVWTLFRSGPHLVH